MYREQGMEKILPKCPNGRKEAGRREIYFPTGPFSLV
jgi:hypothetical protein